MNKSFHLWAFKVKGSAFRSDVFKISFCFVLKENLICLKNSAEHENRDFQHWDFQHGIFCQRVIRSFVVCSNRARSLDKTILESNFNGIPRVSGVTEASPMHSTALNPLILSTRFNRYPAACVSCSLRRHLLRFSYCVAFQCSLMWVFLESCFAS